MDFFKALTLKSSTRKAETNFKFGTWYPIETAPKTSEDYQKVYGPDVFQDYILVGRPKISNGDGTSIGGITHIAKWRKNQWMYPICPDLIYEGLLVEQWGVVYMPTVWMPMPPIPGSHDVPPQIE